jgi:hypothetical protein
MHFANECLLIGLLRTLDISFASLPWHDTSCDKSEIECLQSYLVYGKDHPINKRLYGRDGDSPNDAQRESAGIAAAPDATDAKLPGVSTRAAGAIDTARESQTESMHLQATPQIDLPATDMGLEAGQPQGIRLPRPRESRPEEEEEVNSLPCLTRLSNGCRRLGM